MGKHEVVQQVEIVHFVPEPNRPATQADLAESREMIEALAIDAQRSYNYWRARAENTALPPRAPFVS